MPAKTRVYTEGYAPPEQIIGKPEPRSDLFALAGTLYHLATGKVAGRLLHRPEIEDAAQPTARRTIPAEYRWFYELIKINLAEDINERYFTATEIKADLERQQVTQGDRLPEMPTDEQGARAVLHQVRRAADGRDAAAAIIAARPIAWAAGAAFIAAIGCGAAL